MTDILNLINSYSNLTIFFMAFLSVLFTTFFLKKISLKMGFVDKPSKRSNHPKPIALGGGIGIIAVVLSLSIFFVPNWHTINSVILLILFLISILDDIVNVNIFARLCTHIFCSSLYIISYLADDVSNLFINNFLITKIVIYSIAILSLAWFINAFNFMDGVDGITSVYSITILFSLIFLYQYLSFEVNSLHYLLSGAIIAFLFFNWHPAKIFLGDAGSIPIGFIIAHLLLDLALRGFWVSALILPLYYIMDTSVTIFIRLIQKRKLWESHSDHFYQQGIRKGRTHYQVCYIIIFSSFGTFLLSYFAVVFKNNILFLLIGITWCTFFLLNFKRSINKKN